MRYLLLAKGGMNAETRLKLLTIVDSSATYSQLVNPHWSLHANASQDCDNGSEQTTESSRKIPKLEWPIAYVLL